MNNIRLIIVIFMFALFFACQTLAQQVIPTAGDYFENETFSLSFTFAESITETLSSEEVILTQGFQQPWNFTYTQTLYIPMGWSGISGFIDPTNKNIEDLFMDISLLVFLSNLSGFYFPSQNINTLSEWDYSSGYTAKAMQSFNINLRGVKHEDFALELDSGWNIIPVLSGCNVPVIDVFDEYSGVRVIKEIGELGIYWPEFNINTLVVLQPGKAYFALLNQSCNIVFPKCPKYAWDEPQKNKNEMGITSWHTPVHTGHFHLILIPAELLNKLKLHNGDGLGGFTNSGVCCGITVITDLKKNHCLTIYGNDPFTFEKDGFTEGEPIYIRQFQTQKAEEKTLVIEFDPTFPNQGYFSSHGVSALKLGELSVGSMASFENLRFNLFPNPSNDKVTLTWSQENQEPAGISIYNSFGQTVEEFQYGISDPGNQRFFVDVSRLDKGTYFVKLNVGQKHDMKKLFIIN